jgi:glycosyltransferase involved in cell wall biosynthesis
LIAQIALNKPGAKAWLRGNLLEFVIPQEYPGLSVVLPAYNEEKNLETAISRCLEIIPQITTLPFEIVIVNDGSGDQTGPLLERMAAAHPQVLPLQHLHNLGYGQAVLTGIMHTRYRYLFFTDSDLQFDLRDLRHFFPYLKDYDLILGYRLRRQDSWHRLLFGFAWNKLIYLLFGLKVRDIDCAFKLFRRQVLAPLEIESRGAMFSAEFLIKAQAKGFKFKELGVNHYPRRAGQQTGGQLWVIARAFRELARFFQHWYFPRTTAKETLSP